MRRNTILSTARTRKCYCVRHTVGWIKPEPLDEVMGGRFARLFPNLLTAELQTRDLEELARVMIDAGKARARGQG